MFQKHAVRKDAEKAHKRGDEAELTVQFRCEQANQDEHDCELQKVSEDVQSGTPKNCRYRFTGEGTHE